MGRHLIVAHKTAATDELRRCLLELASSDAAAEFVLLIPATPVNGLLVWDEDRSHEAAHQRAAAARAALGSAGVNVIDAKVGDEDPRNAIADELRSHEDYETVVLSTPPSGISRWLRLDPLARVRRTWPRVRVVHVTSPTTAALVLSGSPGLSHGHAF